MTTDKTVAGAGEDVLKLRIVHALSAAALKTGQTFEQFAKAAEAAGVMPLSNGAQDCTDLEADVRALLGITLTSEVQRRREDRQFNIMKQLLEHLRLIDARGARASAGG